MKRIIIPLLLCMGAVSCSNFLNEELTTKRNMDYYKTSEGLLELANGAYYYTFDHACGSESLYCQFNYGVDEFCMGGDESNAPWNNYDSRLSSTVGTVNGNTRSMQELWNLYYTTIGYANILVKNGEALTDTDTATQNEIVGSGYFFRAFSYFLLVNQWGGVPLKLEPSTGPEFEFTRATAQEVTDQVVADFTKAYQMLPAYTSPGRLSKDAAAHFLAKAKLFRASEKNDEWNSATKKEDLQSVVTLCKEVVANHPLADNFSELWAFTAPDGDNEKLPEIILSAQNTDDSSTRRYNSQHLYYLSRYDDLTAMKRDLSGGRPYSRLGTTYYVFNCFDLENDSRFWKSYKTKNRANVATGNYVVGDLAAMYVINRPGDDRYSSWHLTDEVVYSKTGKTIPNVYVAYPAGQTENGALYAEALYYRFPSMSKFLDGSRTAINASNGQRDMPIARSAETYLMAAEATIRLAKEGTGSYDDAITYINAVRKRAGFKAGEDREAYIDGGGAYTASVMDIDPDTVTYYPENSYYESMGIPETTAATDITITSFSALPAQDEQIAKALGCSSEYDKALCFILNERTRELAGEYHRWNDLARTKTLVKRCQVYNPGAAAEIKDYHLLRPIPQTYLDAIQKDGVNLTSEEKSAQQNPGYLN